MQKNRNKWDWAEYKTVAARRFPDRIYASLNSKGEIVINLKTYERLRDPEAFVLLYDKNSRSIGLKPSSASVQNAVLARVRHNRYNRVIRCMSFLREHNIKLDRTVQFPTAYIRKLPLKEHR